jgi:hypothetical protein
MNNLLIKNEYVDQVIFLSGDMVASILPLLEK